MVSFSLKNELRISKGFLLFFAVLFALSLCYVCLEGVLPPRHPPGEFLSIQFCSNRLSNVLFALAAYRSENSGKVPATLAELYPNYITDKRCLSCLKGERLGASAGYLYDPQSLEVKDAAPFHKHPEFGPVRLVGVLERDRLTLFLEQAASGRRRLYLQRELSGLQPTVSHESRGH
jgi:hypothetical protein